MSKLTDEQIDFLLSQKISLSGVFDATGLPKDDYRKLMKELGKSFAFGVAPCKAMGHTLRTRAGHCIQCDHAKIAYQLRHDEAGAVYLAGSYSAKVIKVGMASDYKGRVARMNAYGYGGFSDWCELAYLSVDRAGQVEFETHRLLSPYLHPISYVRDGASVECRELFSCGFKTAYEAMTTATKGRSPKLLIREDKIAAVYSFPDRPA